MKVIKPTLTLLIGLKHYTPEDEVELDDRHADQLVRDGHAALVEREPGAAGVAPTEEERAAMDDVAAQADEMLSFHGIELPKAQSRKQARLAKIMDEATAKAESEAESEATAKAESEVTATPEGP